MEPSQIALLIKSTTFIASQLQGYYQRRRVERLEAFTRELERRLARAEWRSNPDQFDFLLTRALLGIAADSREFKHRLFAAILVDAFQTEGESAQSSLYISLVERFDVQHIHLLYCLLTTTGKDRGRAGDDHPAIGFAYLVEHIRAKCRLDGSEATDIATATLTDLVNAGLVHTRMNTESSGTIITGLNPIGLLRMQVYRLSPLGRRFAEYVREAPNQPSDDAEH